MSGGSQLQGDLQLCVVQLCSESLRFCAMGAWARPEATELQGLGFGGTLSSATPCSLVRHVLAHPLLRIAVQMQFRRAACGWPPLFTFRGLHPKSAGRLQKCEEASFKSI